MRSARPTRHAIIAVLTLALACTVGCERDPTTRPTGPVEKLSVFAAASLADAFGELGAAFESAHPGVKIEFSFAGSNQLRTQLENGAPGDVFASADRKQMDAAVVSKVVDPATVRVFATNRLAVIVPKRNRAGIKELADLARPGLKVVVADKAVPVGNYTRLMLDKAGTTRELGPEFVKAFEANVISFEENVAAVVAKVALDETDAGIAYASDAAGGNAAKLTVVPLPPALEQRAEYVAAVTVRATDQGPAARLVEFLASKEAAAILVRRGFSAPDARSP